ncbi:hypothetical protein LAJ19_02895 [Deinococcus taeanensis]|uniref:hypothetical protein n=1 Tax=Deinococcus taeanensis TaxID=2737050 RepID=UPI001CDC8A5A|nr:hypothetical protein [Deinococcus taeanensis]UBV43186.1 hypothetical protein LAJ19_02895 [Deinococcus taeanensis]
MTNLKPVQNPERPHAQDAPTTPYTPPTLTPLGRWQAVTLIGSVPFNGLPGLPIPGSTNETH